MLGLKYVLEKCFIILSFSLAAHPKKHSNSLTYDLLQTLVIDEKKSNAIAIEILTQKTYAIE